MDFRATTRSSSDSSTTVYAESADYLHQQLNLKPHWSGNMYPSRQSKPQHSPSKPQLIRASLDEKAKNYNFGQMYSAKESVSDDSMITNQPKKETLWQSFFRSATNLLGEHLTRGTGSLIKNWSNMNNPLSVTVVSPNFYESLQCGKDQKLIGPAEGFFAARPWSQDSQNSGDETTTTVLYDNEISSDSAKRINRNRSCNDTSDSDKRWKEYKCMYINYNGMQDRKESNKDPKIVHNLHSDGCNDEDLESHFSVVIDGEKIVDKSTNFGNTLRVDDEPVMLEKPDMLDQIQQQEQQYQPQSHKSPEQTTTVTTMLSNAYNTVLNGMVDLLQPRSSSPEAETSCLFTKRACSPKPKKLHNISSGRGRGRGKSQLRRSGVSQKRHRKERSRYDQSEDIKNDIDNWEELEYSASTDEDTDICDSGVQPQSDDCDEVDGVCAKRPISYTLGDVQPKKRKPEKKEKKCTSGWAQVSVSRKPGLDNDGDVDIDFKKLRPRQLSESSVDSEDSYCIVFEDDDCSNKDFDSEPESDEDSCMETETEMESEDEEDIEKIGEQPEYDTDVDAHHVKVQFDLKPKVHTMVTWNFAYRAARRGQWEQAARDRERFRIRVNCLAPVLEPVLGKKHRMRIWQDRFEN